MEENKGKVFFAWVGWVIFWIASIIGLYFFPWIWGYRWICFWFGVANAPLAAIYIGIAACCDLADC